MKEIKPPKGAIRNEACKFNDVYDIDYPCTSLRRLRERGREHRRRDRRRHIAGRRAGAVGLVIVDTTGDSYQWK